MKWIIIAFIAGMLLASSCGCSPITNGEVTSKEFVPEHQIEVDDPDITVSYDPPITIPGGSHMETVPDRWYITFGKEDEDGKYKERTVCVEQSTYNQHEVGEWINLDTE
jgi:hypothetical protein